MADLLTYLRPDYYQTFPQFGVLEMGQRLRRLDWALATLLDPVNIETARVHFGENGRTPVSTDLDAVLKYVGIPLRVTSAMRDVPRWRAFPRRLRSHAFLNESYLVAPPSTWITSPGVVSIMLSQLPPRFDEVGAEVLEVGVGSGYHAACLGRLLPQAVMTGVDANALALSAARGLLSATGLANRVTLVNGQARDLDPRPWSLIYATAAARLEDLAWLASLSSRDQSVLQTPRMLTAAEFESEPTSSWLRVQFSQYADYQRGDWRSFVALSTYVISRGVIVEESDAIFDFRFVELVVEDRQDAI